PFHGLAEENLLAIVDIHLNKFVKRAKAVGLKAELTLEARKWFADEVFIAKNGVREIKRLIQHHIENPLSVLMMYDKVTSEDLVKIIRPKDKKGVEIVILKPEDQNKVLEEAVTVEAKMDDGVDDRPPPPPTFKLNETGDENADLPAWKRAQLDASKQQGGNEQAPATPHKVIKVPVMKGFKSTLGKGLGMPKMPSAAMAHSVSEPQAVPDTPPAPVPEAAPDLDPAPVPDVPPVPPAAG
ncbi:MAG: hypothetical protein IJ846_06400, partial [Alphaproteobacteria bacterium]|nr:hypothetical protein [Alphaproteobacteria bacterium]